MGSERTKRIFEVSPEMLSRSSFVAAGGALSCFCSSVVPMLLLGVLLFFGFFVLLALFLLLPKILCVWLFRVVSEGVSFSLSRRCRTANFTSLSVVVVAGNAADPRSPISFVVFELSTTTLGTSSLLPRSIEAEARDVPSAACPAVTAVMEMAAIARRRIVALEFSMIGNVAIFYKKKSFVAGTVILEVIVVVVAFILPYGCGVFDQRLFLKL